MTIEEVGVQDVATGLVLKNFWISEMSLEFFIKFLEDW